MSNPVDIIGVVQELQMKLSLKMASPADLYVVDKRNLFTLCEAFLKLHQALHHLENGWHGAANNEEVRAFCKETRASILSLRLQ